MGYRLNRGNGIKSDRKGGGRDMAGKSTQELGTVSVKGDKRVEMREPTKMKI